MSISGRISPHSKGKALVYFKMLKFWYKVKCLQKKNTWIFMLRWGIELVDVVCKR
jgi:hypothetical protein